MSYKLKWTRGWPYKYAKTYPTWIEAQRAFLQVRHLWPATNARVVCIGIGKEG